MNKDENKPKPSDHSNTENSTSRFEATPEDIDFMLSMTREESDAHIERMRAWQKAYIERFDREAAAKKASNQGWRRIINLMRKFINRE